MTYSNVTGTSGNNNLVFQGIVGFYNETLVNPYTGYTVTISGSKNINNAIYDGLGGTDTLSMTAMGDVVSLVDSVGTVMVKNVEIINAGLDGDVVNMSHASVTYGNITLRGSDGDDLLWSNNGNDTILGGNGNDLIEGGGGNDSLFGGANDDYLAGATGTDSLFGGAGNDTFSYFADALWSGGVTLNTLGSSIPFASTVNLDGKNRSFDTFHGDADESLAVTAAGTDTLLLTSGADVLVISDTLSPSNNIFTPRIAYIDIIEAGAGDDVVDFSGVATVAVTINGGDGHDVLGGSNNADTINGDAGDDRIFGAGGNDALAGGTGDDAYYYELGNGSDTITETSGTDSIVFGAGIAMDDITLSVNGADLTLTIGAETLTIVNHYAADLSGRVESLVFDDNSTFDVGAYVPNADPVANNDAFSGDEDSVLSGNVLDNDTDSNNDTLAVTPATIATAGGGTVELNADGTFTYQGAANFNGTDGFSYTVTDGNGGTSTADVALTVNSVNDAPAAQDDTFGGNEDEAISGSLLDNDSDVDGDALSVDAETLTTANGGSVTINADGTFTYQGAANFNGSDSFTYTTRDSSGASDVANVTIGVAAVNDAPVAQDDSFTGFRNAGILGNVLADNGLGVDTDVDGDTLSVQSGSFLTDMGGSVELNGDGSFTYTPADGFFGEDSFEYTTLDGNGGEATGVVSLTVSLDPLESIIGTNDGETIDGTAADDEIFALGGNDTVKGQNGDDTVYGGEGDDVLYGDDGIFTTTTQDKVFADTILMPSLKEGVNIKNLRPKGDAALGVSEGNLSVDFDATASITFRKGYAGYNNSFGTFGVAEDGTIVSTSMEWANVKTAGVNVTHQIDLPVGQDGGAYGFFLVANGNTLNNGYAGLNVTGEGMLSFVYNYGKSGARAAKVTDAGSKISLVYNDGVTTKVLKGNVLFTTERDEAPTINKDGKTHVVSGLMDTNNLTLNPKAADLASKPVSFTKNGMTISASTGTLIGSGDKIGIKSTIASGNLVSGNEKLVVALSQGAEKMTVSLSDIIGGGNAIDFKIYLNGSATPVLYEHSITGGVTSGKVDISLLASSFGAGLITKIEISSVANSSKGIETFWLDNVQAEIPGGTDTNTLRIGFEDLYNTGDADYEDVLFDLDINPVVTGDVEGGNDILDGGAGNDILYGEGGDDILVIGDGADRAYGGEGADVFALTLVDASVDKIHDFDAGEGDVINISDVLDSYDALSDDIADFVRLVQNGGDTELQISVDGNGSFVAAALIVGGTDDDIATMIANGSLVANQSALA